MLSPQIRDIIKPSWVKIIDEMKRHGEMTIPQLMQSCQLSYMGIKQQCDGLLKLGYLERIRIARTEVGRPEISYRLTSKSQSLFQQAGLPFALNLLRHTKKMFGENAPERILSHFFEDKQKALLSLLKKDQPVIAKAMALASLRQKDGCLCDCSYDPVNGLRIIEFHNPLWLVFTEYPTALQMEKQMMSQLLGSHIERRAYQTQKNITTRVEWHIPVLKQP